MFIQQTPPVYKSKWNKEKRKTGMFNFLRKQMLGKLWMFLECDSIIVLKCMSKYRRKDPRLKWSESGIVHLEMEKNGFCEMISLTG